MPEYSWDEIQRHNLRTDRWIVVDDIVYDVTRFAKKHPGGEKIVSNWSGQNASEAWYAFHPDKKKVSKYMKTLVVGRVKVDDSRGSGGSGIVRYDDFHKLRKAAEDAGYFKPSAIFYVLHLAHIIGFELLGWWILYQYGTGWIPYIIAGLCIGTAQMQAGWNQHDYGHLSVFPNTRWNHWMHIFIINIFKGASSDWWNHRHHNHHSKPNIINSDPDIKLDLVFLVGKVLPVEWGERKKGKMPYNWQQVYFSFLLPPLLLPLYFNWEIPYYLYKKKQYNEMIWTGLFFVRWQFMFQPIVGFWGVFTLFLFARFIESIWFVWATQMSHLPMQVDYDHHDDWVTSQLKATCNVESSAFNDWWSGHLNFQIEHHLFPTMPRHNLHKVAPLVKSLCEKHGLSYQVKPLLTAFKDILGSLKDSGELWYDAYSK
ncbi:hypothetical protein CAPTEDRAFT_121275 [Capitella teleta]|uniref:Cytochrome b5 heme-binding domain-containing protein n=1 Tax=Capitella teleta TaxID=283909 RepID=R7V5K6_CAPTE|nr:hypothetical protein CAPTEDRAFT_121275 [Capitella teleta]|eukprot:ELU14138.1 hypothetical protein CAPTEDRAFT_121275 [Capitella teleta]